MNYIYWFCYFNPRLPSVRYRAKFPLEYLRARHGIRSSIVYPGYDPYSIFRFIRVYLSALLFRKKDSVIVIQKLYTKRVYAAALKWLIMVRRKNTLYDLDDAIFLDFNPKNLDWFIRRCNQGSYGSEELMGYAKKLNDNVHLLGSPVIEHGCFKLKRNPVFTVGWIGCYGGEHKECLFSLVYPALRQLDFKVRLVLLGVVDERERAEVKQYFSGHSNIICEIPEDVYWTDELEVYKRIQEFDAGVCPLLDSPSHRSKSAFKLKQYLSCGVPALGSDIGENGRFLEHGVNGFVCNTVADYAERIGYLKYAGDDEYAKLSMNAAGSAAKFSLAQYCESLINIFGSH
jgi:glycosyltransferase involved in cell wall biosynthesis